MGGCGTFRYLSKKCKHENTCKMSKPSKTLFIRNLPFSTSKEKLEDIFSEFGPIKQCFTVTDRGNNENNMKSH